MIIGVFCYFYSIVFYFLEGKFYKLILTKNVSALNLKGCHADEHHDGPEEVLQQREDESKKISKFRKLIGLIKTLDEFKDGPSVTSLRVRELKTLSLIKLLNTITSN